MGKVEAEKCMRATRRVVELDNTCGGQAGKWGWLETVVLKMATANAYILSRFSVWIQSKF